MESINSNLNLDNVVFIKGKAYTKLPEPDFDEGISGSLMLLCDNFSNNQNKKYVAKICLKKDLFPMFLNETAILEQISHDQIVKYVTSGALEKFKRGKCVKRRYCILSEYYENLSLSHYPGPIDEKIVKIIAKCLVDVIEYLHNEKKIAHRDIKPDNIMLNNDFIPCLIDFGLAQKSDEELKFPKCGTTSYRPPEVFTIEGKKENYPIIVQNFCSFETDYDPFKFDIFSLGVTMLVLSTGKNPFINIEEFGENYRDNYYFKYFLNDKDKFWEIIELNISTELSKELKELIMKLISVYPNERPRIEIVKKDKWFDEIRNLSKNEIKTQLKNYFSSRISC